MQNSYEPAIHFHGVDYSIDDIHILKKITGSFPKGKITTLVGPSGAGKTTLLKLCEWTNYCGGRPCASRPVPITHHLPIINDRCRDQCIARLFILPNAI